MLIGWHRRVGRGSCSSIRSAGATALPPLLAFLLAQGFLWVVALGEGVDYFSPEIWVRWDSVHYLSIAKTGYKFFRCTSAQGYPTHAWCGNTGWFPGYSWMISLLMHVGISGGMAGVILSAGFHAFTIVLLWVAFLDRKLNFPNILCLILAAFFPGQIFYHAVYPISMFSFLALLCLYLLLRQKWLFAGLSGGLAALTYPTGFFLAPVAAAWVVLTSRALPWRERLYRVAATSGFILGSFLLVLLLQYIEVGVWDGFFKVQAKYGHGFHNPAITFLRLVKPLLHGVWLGPSGIAADHTLLLGIMMAAVLLTGILHRRRNSPADRLVLIYSLAYWILPLILGSRVHPLRSASLVLPAAFLVRRLPVMVQAMFVVAAVFLAYTVTILFYWGLAG